MRSTKSIVLIFFALFWSCINKVKDTNVLINPPGEDTVGFLQKTKTSNNDTSLLKIWSAFRKAVSSKDITAFKQLSVDSIEACGTKYSDSQFIAKCFEEVFDTALVNRFAAIGEINHIDKTVERDYFSHHVLEIASEEGKVITLKQFQITKAINQDDGAWTVTFDFLKTRSGYKFFGTDSYGGPVCCR